MTKAEVLDVITVIVMAYPDRIKEDSVSGMVTAWLAFFGEDNPEIVKTAVMKHIACNKWPPKHCGDKREHGHSAKSRPRSSGRCLDACSKTDDRLKIHEFWF